MNATKIKVIKNISLRIFTYNKTIRLYSKLF